MKSDLMPMLSNGFHSRVTLILHGMLFLTLFATSLEAAPRADLWPRWQQYDPASTQRVDHSTWQAFLEAYVVDPHPSGISRVRYGAVAVGDKQRLRKYLEQMQAITVSYLNRQEQLAYWINLYNATTLNIVLEHFPVQSIRDINVSSGFLSKLFGAGPWQAPLLTIEGQPLSLDDIEHRILRPIWRDNRIHYAVNCASLGCPNLQREAFTGSNTERLLNDGARAYINHPRGVSLHNGDLQVSQIYNWFQEDFEGSEQGVLTHLRQHAEPALRQRLEEHAGDISYNYDWSLNDALGGGT